MSVTRRKFITTSAASAAVITSASHVPGMLLRAATASRVRANTADNVLVVVQLSGGNDGLNTVVPYADDTYGRNRFETRIAPNAVHMIDDYLGLHPSMEGMHRLYEAGHLTIVQGVGYPNPNRSHFESMDIWHTAQPEIPQTGRATGWLGKHLDVIAQRESPTLENEVFAAHLGEGVQPLALAGLNVQIPSIGSLENFQFDELGDRRLAAARELLLTAKANGDSPLLAHVRAAAHTAISSSKRVRNATQQSKVSGQYPGTDLGNKLRSIAQLVRAGLATRIYYVTLDGFDTHSLQAESHAALLRELSGAVTAFFEDLSRAGDSQRVVLACFSEFGRRVKENASRGTDHGAAAPMLIVGDRLRGGMVGEHPSLDDLDDGDLKFHTDFRRVYASILEGWLGVDAEPVVGTGFAPLNIFA